MSDVLFIDGVDVSLMNVRISSLGPVWSPPETGRTFVPIPGRVGAVPQGLPTGREKRIPVTLWLDSVDVANRQPYRDLWQRHLGGLMRIEWSDAPGRHHWAILDRQAHSALFESMAFAYGDLRMEAELVVPDAVGWSSSPTVLGLAADTEAPVLLGTATSAPRIIVPGPWTDLRLSVMSPTGEELSALQLGGSITSDEVAEIDSNLNRIVVETISTGARAHRRTLYDSGSFPLLDPHDAIGAAMPSLLSTEDAVAIYTRAWE